VSQPDWKCIVNLGDVNPIDYGGKFVLVDKTGKYAPEMEVLDPVETCGEEVWRVWRFIMDRCTYIDGVLSDNPYHPGHAVWYADDIDDIAQMYDKDREQLIGELCSDDPRERAEGYYCLFGYYPAENFDSYPLDLDREEVEERYSQAPYCVEV
jgi:hypothetical protein